MNGGVGHVERCRGGDIQEGVEVHRLGGDVRGMRERDLDGRKGVRIKNARLTPSGCLRGKGFTKVLQEPIRSGQYRECRLRRSHKHNCTFKECLDKQKCTKYFAKAIAATHNGVKPCASSIFTSSVSTIGRSMVSCKRYSE